MTKEEQSIEGILRFIEVADPDNRGALDEINGLVHYYLNPHERRIKVVQDLGTGPRLCMKGEDSYYVFTPFATSRNALKKIRPNWLEFKGIYRMAHGYHADFVGMGSEFRSSIQETEELAELACVLQAIEYGRTHKLGCESKI